jgi:O-acetyl-ADP-ribose deacetylase (regulator of RNase III)
VSEHDSRVGLVVGDTLRLRLVRKIGEGGMGTVYLAENTASRLHYAVKLLQPRLCQSETALRRFFREALAASSIRHPGVVGVVDVGKLPDGTGYYTMELLAGEDLATTLSREQRLSWPRALHIALQICDAMASVHAHDIVHRDLKPANCFRMTRGEDPDFIKILDFGVAKIAHPDVTTLTGSDALIGTVPYMAPELLGDAGAHDGDRRVDVWATGVILFEMLAGRRPFQAANVFQLIGVILRQPAPALRDVAPVRDFPDALEPVLARALSKDPDARFSDMNALAAALRELADVPAPPRVAAAPVDALARTAARDGLPDAAALARENRAAIRQLRERAAFYVNPASRWAPEVRALPGGTHLEIARGDLCLAEADAILCAIGPDGPRLGTLVRRLCEFGGPDVAELVAASRDLSYGTVVVVGGGRLTASHVVCTAQPVDFAGIDPLRRLIARVVAACLAACASRDRRPRVHSLAVPLLFTDAAGLPRRAAFETLVEAFIDALATAPPLSLGVLRLLINDDGEQLARAGGELIVNLPHDRVDEHERTQRFVLGRYPTVRALSDAILHSIPARLRPPPESYGIAWTLRRPQAPRPLEHDVVRGVATPHDIGLVAGTTLDLALRDLPLDAAASDHLDGPLPDDWRSRCAVIDWSVVTDGAQGEVPVLCTGYDTTTALLDDVWAAFPPQHRPPPFTYGTAWALRNRATGRLVPYTRDGSVPVAAVGFVPGSAFEVLWLRG